MALHRPSVGYRILSLVLFVFWFMHALWQAGKTLRPAYFWQRMGISGKTKPKSIWLHASSIGEIEMIKPIVDQLRPQHPVLVTTFTATGFSHALKTFPPQIQIKTLPIDFLPISQHFISRHQFKLGLIAETELWPETLYQAQKQKTPLLQINARVTSRTLDTPRWIRQILQDTLAYFDLHLTRSQAEKNKLMSLGVPEDKISLTGNLKQGRPHEQENHDDLIGQPYLLFASTHHPEEELFARLMKDIELQEICVIAPRHPGRAKEIIKSLRHLNLNIKQRSRGHLITHDTDLYLADTLGELKALIAHAEIVIMGGSFAPVGGHNVLEPASLGKPIITGPSDDNIQQDIHLLLEHDAIIQVKDIDELGETIKSLLKKPDKCRLLAENSLQLMNKQQHVLENYLRVIQGYL